MSISAAPIAQPKIALRISLPVWAGLGVYVLLMLAGDRLLNDPDTYWQVKVGQWILDSGSLPRTDSFSFTMTGQPWISTQWLAQTIYAIVFGAFGWTGLVVLTSASVALTFALLARFLCDRLQNAPALILLLCVFAIGAPHFLARPHTLALPVMVAWVAGLMEVAERRHAPSPSLLSIWLLPLMVLWANLHGSFILGLALVGPIALEAPWNVQPSNRKECALRWFGFWLAAVLAACLTPYGWNSLLAAQKILSLGQALSLIAEWRPVDLSKWEGLQLCLFAGFGGILLMRARFSPARILLLLGLFYMALSHSRNVDVFALLSPVILATPLAANLEGARKFEKASSAQSRWNIFSVMAVAASVCVFTFAIASMRRYSPPVATSPAAAIAVLQERKVSRVFNDYDFGGYLIWAGIPTFIDGRTELFGENFMVRNDEATSLKNPDMLLEMLRTYNIEATLLHRTTPAVHLLDRLDGWTRIHTDDAVVVHVRTGSGRGIDPR